MPLNLMPHARENLAKLRDFLWANREKISVDMNWYGDLSIDKYDQPIDVLAECGSVGCAVGWAPKVVPVHKDFMTGSAVRYWDYAHEELCKLDESSSYYKDGIFTALFGCHWADANKDPATIGVVFRIDTILATNEIPEEFDLLKYTFDSEDEYEQMVRKYHNRRAEWLQQQGIPI